MNEAFVKRYVGRDDSLGIHIGEGAGPASSPAHVSKAKTPARPSTSRFAAPLEQAIPSIRRIVRHAAPRLPILWFRTLVTARWRYFFR